jgi:AcrR family transcriptional regulator
MTDGEWLREQHSDLASDRILDAAAELFVRQGLGPTSMADVAREAGCSRATVYRYFDSRQALRTAFVHRETRRVAAEVATEIAPIEDPAERAVEAIVRSVSKVRSQPTLWAWFTSDNFGITLDVIAASEVIAGVATGFFGHIKDPVAAEWMLRAVVSLALLPGADEESERAMLRRFVTPAVSLI